MTIQKIKVQTITHSFSVRLPDLDSAPAGIDMKSNPADALEQIRRKKYGILHIAPKVVDTFLRRAPKNGA